MSEQTKIGGKTFEELNNLFKEAPGKLSFAVIVAEFVLSSYREVAELEAERDALKADRDKLRKRDSELRRKCQQWESAVKKCKEAWDAHGMKQSGSFLRALLWCRCSDLEEENAALKAEVDQLRKSWLRNDSNSLKCIGGQS